MYSHIQSISSDHFRIEIPDIEVLSICMSLLRILWFHGSLKMHNYET